MHHHHPAGAVLSPEKISAALLAQRQESNGTRPFYDELIQVLGFLRSGASDFLRYLERSGLAEHFTADSEYTAFVPMDDSFAQWYPIDWGFNPFDVDQFVQETILNHFVSGLHRQTNLTDGQVLTTLGGKKLKISTQRESCALCCSRGLAAWAEVWAGRWRRPVVGLMHHLSVHLQPPVGRKRQMNLPLRPRQFAALKLKWRRHPSAHTSILWQPSPPGGR